jgi:hypothetical protein
MVPADSATTGRQGIVRLEGPMTARARAATAMGTTEPNLLLHAVVGDVTGAAARIADDVPSLKNDGRAFRRAARGLRRQVEGTQFVKSAGSTGRAPTADPAHRIDLLGLLRHAAEAAGWKAVDDDEFASILQEDLKRLAGVAEGPREAVTADDRALAERLKVLFLHAANIVAGMYGQPSERVLATLV